MMGFYSSLIHNLEIYITGQRSFDGFMFSCVSSKFRKSQKVPRNLLHHRWCKTFLHTLRGTHTHTHMHTHRSVLHFPENKKSLSSLNNLEWEADNSWSGCLWAAVCLYLCLLSCCWLCLSDGSMMKLGYCHHYWPIILQHAHLLTAWCVNCKQIKYTIISRLHIHFFLSSCSFETTAIKSFCRLDMNT